MLGELIVRSGKPSPCELLVAAPLAASWQGSFQGAAISVKYFVAAKEQATKYNVYLFELSVCLTRGAQGG